MPLICNKDKLIQIIIPAKINIHGYENTLPILVDTGATSSTIDEKIIPEDLKK